jgi:hypothetical protein
MLRRERPDSVNVLSIVGGPEIFNMSDFRFNFEPGIDLGVLYHNGCGTAIEGRYLGVWDTDDSRDRGALPGGTVIAFGTMPPPSLVTLPSTTVFRFDYESELNSGELNLRRGQCDNFTLLAGVRYLNLNESFIAQLDFIGVPVGVATATTEVDNQLYGLQVGAEGVFWSDSCGRFSLGGFGKGGIYHNSVEHEGTFQYFGAAPPNFDTRGRRSESEVTFVAETGVNFTYCITCNCSLVVGYQALWLDGVALASDQITSTGNLFLSEVGIDVDGDVFYHGALAGAVVSF